MAKSKSLSRRGRTKNKRVSRTAQKKARKAISIKLAHDTAAGSIGKPVLQEETARRVAYKTAAKAAQEAGISLKISGIVSEQEARAAVDATLANMAEKAGLNLKVQGKLDRQEARSLALAEAIKALENTGVNLANPNTLTRREALAAALASAGEVDSPETVRRNVFRLIASQAAETARNKINTTEEEDEKDPEPQAEPDTNIPEPENRRLFRQIAEDAAARARNRNNSDGDEN